MQSARDFVHDALKCADLRVMSSNLSDAFLAEQIRALLKQVRKSQRDVSRELGVPYRSVQTYLAGETRIPATFLLDLCRWLDVEPEYLTTGEFRLRRSDLYDAVIRGLDGAGLLPDRQKLEESGARVELAHQVTATVVEAYDRYRRETLFK